MFCLDKSHYCHGVSTAIETLRRRGNNSNRYFMVRISMCISRFPHFFLLFFCTHPQHLLFLDSMHGSSPSLCGNGMKLKSDRLGMNFGFQTHTY